MWQVVWVMWDNRNYVDHNCSTTAKCRQEEDLDEDIRWEYILGPRDLGPKDKYLLEEPIKEVLKYWMERKIIWLKLVDAARKRCDQSWAVAREAMAGQ